VQGAGARFAHVGGSVVVVVTIAATVLVVLVLLVVLVGDVSVTIGGICTSKVASHDSPSVRLDVAPAISTSIRSVYARWAADHPMLAAVHLGTAVAHERLGNVHEAKTQSARAREILDTSLVSPGSNPMRILARRRDALARMGSC
jgi:hypothetical protein